MSEQEKRDLILFGISHRHLDYLTVMELKDKTLYEIEVETWFTKYFIIQCRKIAGWTRRKR